MDRRKLIFDIQNVFFKKIAGAIMKTGGIITMKKTDIEKEYDYIAVTLARLYGIAETLNPWEYKENQEFFHMIEEWTNEFLESDHQDILKFFESQIQK